MAIWQSMTKGCKREQFRQCSYFCTADFQSWLVYKSAVQKPKHCLTCSFLPPLFMTHHSSSPCLCSEQVVLRGNGLVGDGRGEVEAGRAEALHRAIAHAIVERSGVPFHDCAKKGEEEDITHSPSLIIRI